MLTLIAWLLATGAQWDALQVVAWGRMFAVNLTETSFGDALTRTFSPEGACALCKAVSAAKKNEQRAATDGTGASKAFGKIVFVLSPRAHAVTPVTIGNSWEVILQRSFSKDRAAPDLRPPRVCCV